MFKPIPSRLRARTRCEPRTARGPVAVSGHPERSDVAADRKVRAPLYRIAVMPSSPNSPPRRLLVRGVNWLGDAVMTTPALQRLRERFPETHITLLTHKKLADLWLQHPSVDDVITFVSGEGPWSIARRLRGQSFD